MHVVRRKKDLSSYFNTTPRTKHSIIIKIKRRLKLKVLTLLQKNGFTLQPPDLSGRTVALLVSGGDSEDDRRLGRRIDVGGAKTEKEKNDKNLLKLTTFMKLKVRWMGFKYTHLPNSCP